MSNFFKSLRDDVLKAIEDLAGGGFLPAGLDLSAISVDPPRDAAHGDAATNAALVLAGPAGKKPRAIADALAGRLRTDPRFATVDVAGPGFINLRLASTFWPARLAEILRAGTAYGDSTLGEGRRVNVEYVSANPTGPMHVGHGRGAVMGDALASLLVKAGFDVTREYYVNDAGAQVDVLARSLRLRYLEALGETPGPIPEGLYPGEYLVEAGAALAMRDGAKWKDGGEAAWLPELREFAIARMMDLIRDDLAALGIAFDRFSSERALVADGAVDRAVALLERKGLLYIGVLDPPKGMKPDDWEERPQLLFRSTAFGDDVDRPLRKSDGSWTYFAGDVAYHLDKVRRGFLDLIDVWGADHGGYVKRVQAAVSALTDRAAHLDVKLCQLVKVLDGGQPVRMSKRAGNFVTLRDVIDAVGKDVVRFIMLTRRGDQSLDFDLRKVTEQSRENPVFYVQYAHARASSVLRLAPEVLGGEAPKPGELADAPLGHLDAAQELELIRVLATWPRVVEQAAESHEPHRIAYYLQDLAAAFHGLWNQGKDNASLRFLVADDRALTMARLALVEAVRIVIASGLAVMGVTPVEEM